MNNSNLSSVIDLTNISDSSPQYPELHGLFRNPSDFDTSPFLVPSIGNENSEDEISSIIQPLLPPQIDYDKISQSIDLTQHNQTHFFRRIYFNPSFSNIALLIVLIIFIIWVIVLNCLTIVGLWKTHKKGHVVDFYLANLAFGDVLLGILILPLISVVILLGYFPFSSYLCDAWVFLDYYLIVASSYGFTALMCNYLWMIRWPQTFPLDFKHHILALILTWTAVNVSWTPPFFNDRLTVFYPTGACGFGISRNQYFSFYIGMSGFYIPLAISLICGIWSLAVLKRYSGLPLFSFGTVDDVLKRHAGRNLSVRTRGETRHNTNVNNGIHESSSAVPNSSLYGIRRLLSHSHNTRGQTHRIFKTAKAHYPLVIACFLLFIFTRCMFYIYFGVGSFVHHWFPTDISNGVYWLMHSNAAISPLLHFWFDPELRKAITIILRMNKNSSEESSSEDSGPEGRYNNAVSPIMNSRNYVPERNGRTLDESGILPSISISMGHGHDGMIQPRSGDSYDHFLYSKNRRREDFDEEILLKRSPPECEGRSRFQL